MKIQHFTIMTRIFLPLLVCLMVCSGQALSFNAAQEQGLLAQLNLKWNQLNESKTLAQAAQVDILSPTVFAEGCQILDDVKPDLDKGRDVKGIGKKLNRVDELFKQALKNAAEARKQLPELIQAREDAIASGAPSFAPQLYENAEKSFADAVKCIEGNDINNSIKKGKEAESIFRDAELLAIKASIIGQVHDLQRQAKDEKADKFAPITYANSIKLITEAEETLNTNRSEQTAARKKAEEAEYEARHAIFLSKLVQDNKKSDENWEAFVLNNETEIKKLTDEMGISAQFDEGIKEPVKSVLLAIKALKQQKKDLTAELDAKNNEITKLREETQKLSQELDQTKEKEAGLTERLEAKKRQEETLKKVEELFDKSEAVVLREGSRLIIRLVGLSFAPGKSEIEPQYFELLTKVQQAIREFPDAKITIEGHTDSRGLDAANTQLSQQRAKAVQTYLIANMGLEEDKISSMGYGKNKPIASNDTEEGRKKNRRIDVVLEIGEAGY